jgi:hypothetical protein
MLLLYYTFITLRVLNKESSIFYILYNTLNTLDY